MTNLIVDSQTEMRKYAKDQLFINLGHATPEVEKIVCLSSHSCVSQRDIQRVFDFYEWFMKLYSKYKHHGDHKDYHRRAVLVALGMVYYMRLDTEFRQRYIEYLDSQPLSNKLSFTKAFNEELDYFIKQVDLPRGTAHTVALKENILATIVCTMTHTPLIIIGDPGSSKTFSFNQSIANLKGQESKKQLFQDTDIFSPLDPHFYQCSHHTTSNEIETVFSRAINRQRSHRHFHLTTYCVVFMDEAGLPEESHESLKVLHCHLDKKEVSFVAITNHALDAAKTNRAISLFRPKASQEDLETLAKGCLCSGTKDPPQAIIDEVVTFCQPYMDCMKKTWFSQFFGLRDFHHFIIYMQRYGLNNQRTLSHKLVLQALERNFSGSDKFDEICKTFLPRCSVNSIPEQRGILDVFKESIEDKPQDMMDYNAVRYKLVIDPSEDNSLIRLLFSSKTVKRENLRMFICSDFPSDGEIQMINTIAAIRHSAVEGHMVVMCQTDDIHASFYDLFNQRFRRIDCPEKGPCYYSNIAIGAHSKPSKVHPNFQCVIVIKKSEVSRTPAPFLNRFEKYSISHGSLLKMALQKLPGSMTAIMKAAQDKVVILTRNEY